MLDPNTPYESQFNSRTVKAAVVGIVTAGGALGWKFLTDDADQEKVANGIIAGASLVTPALCWIFRVFARRQIKPADDYSGTVRLFVWMAVYAAVGFGLMRYGPSGCAAPKGVPLGGAWNVVTGHTDKPLTPLGKVDAQRKLFKIANDALADAIDRDLVTDDDVLTAILAGKNTISEDLDKAEAAARANPKGGFSFDLAFQRVLAAVETYQRYVDDAKAGRFKRQAPAGGRASPPAAGTATREASAWTPSPSEACFPSPEASGRSLPACSNWARSSSGARSCRSRTVTCGSRASRSASPGWRTPSAGAASVPRRTAA